MVGSKSLDLPTVRRRTDCQRVAIYERIHRRIPGSVLSASWQDVDQQPPVFTPAPEIIPLLVREYPTHARKVICSPSPCPLVNPLFPNRLSCSSHSESWEGSLSRSFQAIFAGLRSLGITWGWRLLAAPVSAAFQSGPPPQHSSGATKSSMHGRPLKPPYEHPKS